MLVGRPPGGALSTPDDGARHVQVGGGLSAARKNERVQRPDLLTQIVAPPLQPVDAGLHDAQRLPGRIVGQGCGQVGPQVEQLVLDQPQRLVKGFGQVAAAGDHAEHRVGFVHLAVGLDPQVGLGRERHVRQAGLAGVAGSGVDPGQLHHGFSLTMVARGRRWVWQTRSGAALSSPSGRVRSRLDRLFRFGHGVTESESAQWFWLQLRQRRQRVEERSASVDQRRGDVGHGDVHAGDDRGRRHHHRRSGEDPLHPELVRVAG
ncbi:protein of unknown function [Micropruina glycogenica]|uniref:Uncharacterized protein n=1 Tax=Micropruina glycogenica TaxID=75385 RepID=A0A2N9JFC2_9ACTN|nr:protein of unknown function [Micropruina glycogenica]